MLGTLGLWLGGYTYFLSSDDWHLAKKTISEAEAITSAVGQVRDISTSPFKFSYRSSGLWAEIDLGLLINGDKGEAKFKVRLEKIEGKWILLRIQRTN